MWRVMHLLHILLPLGGSGAAVLDLATRMDAAICHALALLVTALTFLMFLAAPLTALVCRRHPHLLAAMRIASAAGLPLSAVSMAAVGAWLPAMNIWQVYLLWAAGYALVIASLYLLQGPVPLPAGRAVSPSRLAPSGLSLRNLGAILSVKILP